jgi:acyl carrier protein
MEIAKKVKEIISQQLDVDMEGVEDTASFIDDLGADSLAIVELVLAFEEQFEIDIPDEDTEKIRTVGDAVSYISANAQA